MLPFEAIAAYRYQTYRLAPELRLQTPEQAAEFVRERGFVYFWPITGITLPSLWAAAAGDRPVADEHDDPGHVTWGWKDSSLGSTRWYYAKVLRKKATLIGLEMLPYFYALTENYGAPEEDYLTLYEQGRLTVEAKTLYETLLDRGPLDTIELRRATHMSSPTSEGRFNKALVDLQANFNILPVGISEAGAWHYCFIYDVVTRRYPDLPDQAHEISEAQARRKLAELYFRSVGAAPLRDLVKLFGWSLTDAERASAALAQDGLLRLGVKVENQPGEWAAIAQLVPAGEMGETR